MTLQDSLEYRETIKPGWTLCTKLNLVAIEPTNTCQLGCSVCWSQCPKLYPARPKGFMSMELFDKILKELIEVFDWKNMTIGLSYGGEPTLHPQFEQMAKRCHDVGFKNLQLPTNGITLNKHMRKVILENFKEVAVSIHKSPHLSDVIEKTKLLVAERGPMKFTPNIRANVVMDEFTQKELDTIAQKLGGHVDAFKSMNMISEDLKTVCDKTPLWPYCPSPYVYMGIMWNGDVLPCCHILSPGHWSLGNVSRDTIRKVWLSPPYKALRQARFTGTICEHCNMRR